jgi:hypothetical protein
MSHALELENSVFVFIYQSTALPATNSLLEDLAVGVLVLLAVDGDGAVP